MYGIQAMTTHTVRYLLNTLVFLTMAPAATAQSPGPASQEHDRGWVSLGFCNYSSELGATANLGRKRAYQVGYHVRSDALVAILFVP